MNIEIRGKHLHLSDEQKEYITEKFTKILHYSERANDESTRITVDVAHEKTENKNRQISCVVNVFVPKDTLRAESYEMSVEAAVDACEEKLKTQVQKYKLKMQHTV